VSSTPVIGVDVGGTKVYGCLIDAAHPTQALAESRRDTPRGGDAVIDAIAAVVDDLRRAASPASPPGVGVGVPGLLDTDGVLRLAPNLPGVSDLAVADRLGERLAMPVLVENDATAATWAEVCAGAAQGASDAVLVTLGTGIGAGVVMGGRLQRGAHGFAGEAGHVLVDPHGPPCPCGRRGCWERYASGSGLGRLGRDAAQGGRADRVVALAGGDPEQVRGEHVTAAGLEGDAGALAVIDEFGWWLAVGIANLVNVLDVGVVVVGGGLAEAGELLLAPARVAYEGLVLGHGHRPPVPIVRATMGNHAGAIGSALLAAGAPARSPTTGS
jgi:glucokinase